MVSDSWREAGDEPKPRVFAFPLLACVLLGLVVYYGFVSTMLFISLSFLLIVLVAQWFGRKGLWVALFLGILSIALPVLMDSAIAPESLFSAVMLCIVAFLVGTIVEQKKYFMNENRLVDQKCKKLDDDKRAILADLKTTTIAGETSRRKSRFLSGIMHNDIFNNLSALIGSLDLLKTKTTDPDLLVDIDRADDVALTIKRQIEFARTYEIIGTSPPQWLNADKQVHALLSSLPDNEVTFSISLKGLEIFVDPLFEKVFANLINNSFLHGVRVSHISVSYLPFNRDIAIVYEDDGIGIHAVDKSKIFEKGVGKKPGFGLFLSREILSVTGLSVKECGVYGKGARFEIFVPEGKFRFTSPDGSGTSPS